MAPPRNAAGTEPRRKGSTAIGLTKPARAKRRVTMLATRMFSTSAVGRITSGATPTSAMIAR